MRLQQYKLLTDENIHPDVVQFLRHRQIDVLDVCEQKLIGTADVALIRRAFSEDCVIVTHDRDFGTLAILKGEPVVGIVYLRPGHINPSFTIETIETILNAQHELVPPFILVAQRRDGHVAIRLRQL